jgi:hypothetical protein
MSPAVLGLTKYHHTEAEAEALARRWWDDP